KPDQKDDGVRLGTLAVCFELLCASPPLAVEARAQFIIGPDDRKTIDSLDSPWNAIGKVQYTIGNSAYAYCTGTLVAPRLVLTADTSCHVRARTGSSVMTDCDSDPAQSGGPVLTESNGRISIAGVMVSHQRDGNVAVPVEFWRNLARGASCPSASAPLGLVSH